MFGCAELGSESTNLEFGLISTVWFARGIAARKQNQIPPRNRPVQKSPQRFRGVKLGKAWKRSPAYRFAREQSSSSSPLDTATTAISLLSQTRPPPLYRTRPPPPLHRTRPPPPSPSSPGHDSRRHLPPLPDATVAASPGRDRRRLSSGRALRPLLPPPDARSRRARRPLLPLPDARSTGGLTLNYRREVTGERRWEAGDERGR